MGRPADEWKPTGESWDAAGATGDGSWKSDDWNGYGGGSEKKSHWEQGSWDKGRDDKRKGKGKGKKGKDVDRSRSPAVRDGQHGRLCAGKSTQLNISVRSEVQKQLRKHSNLSKWQVEKLAANVAAELSEKVTAETARTLKEKRAAEEPAAEEPTAEEPPAEKLASDWDDCREQDAAEAIFHMSWKLDDDFRNLLTDMGILVTHAQRQTELLEVLTEQLAKRSR